jgi:hypothetical protein
MAEFIKMTEGKFGGFVVVESDIGVGGAFAIGRYGDDGSGAFDDGGSVKKEEAIDGALLEHDGVALNEVVVPMVTGGEVEVVSLEELLFNAGHDLGEVAFTEVGRDDADGHAAAGAQGAGEEVGSVTEAVGGFADAIAGALRNGAASGRIIENKGDGGGREASRLRFMGWDFFPAALRADFLGFPSNFWLRPEVCAFLGDDGAFLRSSELDMDLPINAVW